MVGISGNGRAAILLVTGKVYVDQIVADDLSDEKQLLAAKPWRR